jgi:hypothetical protein
MQIKHIAQRENAGSFMLIKAFSSLLFNQWMFTRAFLKVEDYVHDIGWNLWLRIRMLA